MDYPRRRYTGVRRFVPSWRLVLGLGAAVVLLGVIALSVVYAKVSVPDPNKLVTAQASIVYFSDGKTELGRFNEVDGNRQSIALTQVPKTAQHAVLAAEDRSFYSNFGVSPKGIARAVWVKLRGGSVQGGSTITQQYVKNYFLTQDRTYTRKLKEFVISLKIEQQETKDVILANYLNTIYFGRGANGIETASQAYFGHPASKLTVAEGALLASVIRSPGLYDPITQKARTQARMAYVLDGMVSEGWLTQAERAKVTYPKISPRRTANTKGGTTGYLLKAVQDELRAKVGLTDAQIDQGGLRVISTFDRRAQAAAVQAVKDELPKEDAKGVRAGLVAIKPGDGAVIAMYGGPDQVKQPLNAATQSIMQAGSTFKPFALAAALEGGGSLRSRYSGANHQIFPGTGGNAINNFGNESFGQIDLVTATANSVNTAFVALNIDTGPQKTMDAAIAAGVPKDTTGLGANIGNVLGDASPHVIDMADAYATFAAQGVHASAYVVRSAVSVDGAVTYQVKTDATRVFAADTTADLTYALQQVTRSGSGSYAGSNLDRPVAGKTGTSSSNLSAWFSGYTPQLAASVGIYRDSGGNPVSLRGLGGLSDVTGGSFPVRIWTAFIKGALEGAQAEDFPPPVYGGTSNAPVYTPPPATSSTTTSTPTATATVTAPPTDIPPAPAPTVVPPAPPTITGPPVTQGANPAASPPTGQG